MGADRCRLSTCTGVQKNYLVSSQCPVVGFHLIGRTDHLSLAERSPVFGPGAGRAPDAVSHMLRKIEPFAIARLAAHVAPVIGHLQRATARHGNPPNLPSSSSIRSEVNEFAIRRPTRNHRRSHRQRLRLSATRLCRIALEGENIGVTVRSGIKYQHSPVWRPLQMVYRRATKAGDLHLLGAVAFC